MSYYFCYDPFLQKSILHPLFKGYQDFKYGNERPRFKSMVNGRLVRGRDMLKMIFRSQFKCDYHIRCVT